MKAMVPTAPRTVCLDDVPEPRRGPGEALVAVDAYSVNRGETFLLDDPRPGWRPGKDIAGVVLEPAADGGGPAAGTRVVGHPAASGWAERAAVESSALAEVPDSISMTTAAALPLAGLTAVRLLRRIGSLVGRRLLITGASGGVGHYLVELARAGGADVTAVASTAERGARLRAFGASTVIDVGDAPGRFDIALESVGGPSFTTARRKVWPDGRLIWFGQAGGRPVTLDFFDWVDGTVGADVELFHYADGIRPLAEDLSTLVGLVRDARLHPEIGRVEAWQQTAEVIAALRDRRVRGNAVLTVQT